MRRNKTTFPISAQAARVRFLLIAALLAVALFALGVPASAGPATSSPLGGVPTTSTQAEITSGAIIGGAIVESAGPTPFDRIVRSADASDGLPPFSEDLVASLGVTATPAATRSVAPGYSISYTFSVTNEATTSGIFDLTTTGTAGFDTTINDMQHEPISSVALQAWETTAVVVAISVPETAAVGITDTSTLTVTGETSPSVSAQASVFTEVLDGLTLSPGTASNASPGDDVSFTHTIRNSLPTTESVQLSAVDAHDWPVSFYAADGVTLITSITVGPFGGQESALARVSVPADASRGETDTLTFEASTASATADATDTMFVRLLDTYAGASDTTPCSAFRLGDTVYARGMGLVPGSVVCFVWTDARGEIAQTSATSTVDTSGTASDQYASGIADPVGTWTVELHADSAQGPVIDSREFSMTFKGQITALSATDGRDPNALIAVSSTVQNETSQEITGSTESYLIWWDANSDGIYDSGDQYVDASGTPQPYLAVASTHDTPVASVAASGTWMESAPWTVANTQFPNQGTYNVTATWRSDSGAVIDQRTAQFYAIPTLGWPPFLLLTGTVGLLLWRQQRPNNPESRRRLPRIWGPRGLMRRSSVPSRNETSRARANA